MRFCSFRIYRLIPALLFALSFAVAGEPNLPEVQAPWMKGERLEFDLCWGPITAGFASLEVKPVKDGKTFDTNWTGTIETGSVELTELNEDVAAEGTAAKLEEVEAGLKDGSIHVFDTSTFTVEGATLDSYEADVESDPDYAPDTEVISDGYFHESEYRSAPYFNINIDGINLLDTNFG